MRRSLILVSVVAVGLALLATACGGDGDQAAAEAAATAEPASTTGEVEFDQAFIDAVVPHHRQAIEMAQAAKDAGLDEPELVEIADAIITTQQTEIDQMLEWRKQWFGSEELDPNAAEVLGVSMEDMGMAVDASTFATTEDVNAHFANLMMDHHNGAIAMAEMALERASRPEIVDVAEQIIEAQQQELQTMQPYATDMGDMDMSGDALP